MTPPGETRHRVRLKNTGEETGEWKLRNQDNDNVRDSVTWYGTTERLWDGHGNIFCVRTLLHSYLHQRKRFLSHKIRTCDTPLVVLGSPGVVVYGYGWVGGFWL